MTNHGLSSMNSRAPVLLVAAAFLFSLSASPARAQTNTRIVVGFSAGGGIDILARVIAVNLAKISGASAIVENITGASGSIAAQTIAKAPPDGRTLLFVSSAHAMNAAIQERLPFDAVNDFTPIIGYAESLNVIVVHPSLNVTTLKGLVDHAKSNPGKLNYGSAGVGTNSHMSTELLKYRAGIDLTHIPYRGAAPYLMAMLTGEVHLAVVSLQTALPYINDRRLVPLAVTTRTRSTALPDVPTAEEAGVAGYEYSVWYGMLGPPKMPTAVVERLYRDINATLSEPDVQTRLDADGAKPVGSSPAVFGKFLEADLEKWKDLAVRASIKAQ